MSEQGRRSWSPIVRIATALGCTQGQAYTLVIALVLAVATIWLGIPPTLRERVAAVAAQEPTVATAPPFVPGPNPTAAPRSALAPVPVEPSEPPRVPQPSARPMPTAPAAPAAPRPSATELGAVRIAATVPEPGAPDGVGIDPQGRTVVATNNSTTRGTSGASVVFRFTPDGNAAGSVAIEGQPSTRTAGLGGLVVDGAGRAFITDTATARILRVDIDARRQATYAQIPDLPACGLVAVADACEPGTRDELPQPRGLVLDPSGGLYVADVSQAMIWYVDTAARAKPWAFFEDTDAPVALARERNGSILVGVARSLSPDRVGRGSLHRIEVRSDRSAGERKAVLTTEPLDDPSGIAVGEGGEIVLSLTGANALVLLGPDGKERDRIDATEAESRTGIPLDGPGGVVASGRSVWVSNGSPRSNTAANWVVFEVGLGA